MSRQILFNGVVLVRAGGATKIDASAFQTVGAGGVGVVGVIGEADAGEPNAVISFRTPQAMVEAFKSGPLADVADLLFRPMNDTRVPSGAAQVLAIKVNQAIQATKAFNTGANIAMTVTSKDWGAHTNKINVKIATSGTGKAITLVYENGADRFVESSPMLGGTAEFTLLYTGAGTIATATITATTLTTTITGGPGSENLSLTFAAYPTLRELINAINTAASGVYTAVAVTTNPFAFLNANLDRVTAVDIKTGAYSAFAKLYRVIEWINTNSALVTAVRGGPSPAGDAVPDNTPTVGTNLASGLRGISSNTNWQDGFDLLGAVRINQLVPLCSQNLTNEGNDSTATFASVVAAADAHAAFYSSTKGKSEREVFIGMKGTKTVVLAQAGAFQSPHTVLTSHVVTRTNAAADLVAFPEWGFAAIAAGGRAGSVLGEPLVYKNIRASGLTQDTSWNPLDDGEDMILGGVTFAFAPPNQGFKFDRVVTTYTKLDNDAFVEESIVQGWKNVSYGLRTQLENIFTGTRGLPATIQKIKDAAGRILEAYRQEGQIVDSILEDGTVLIAYRDLHVLLSGDVCSLSAIISPVAGINFQLQTLFLVPAQISA